MFTGTHCCHNDNFGIPGGTMRCHYDCLWSPQWWQSWHHDDPLISEVGDLNSLIIWYITTTFFPFKPWQCLRKSFFMLAARNKHYVMIPYTIVWSKQREICEQLNCSAYPHITKDIWKMHDDETNHHSIIFKQLSKFPKHEAHEKMLHTLPDPGLHCTSQCRYFIPTIGISLIIGIRKRDGAAAH